MADKFYEQARIGFQKLSPTKNDIIAIKFPSDMSLQQVYQTVSYLSQIGDEFGCAVIALGQGVDIQVMTDEEMNELGWQRIEEKRVLN